jgi:hypothetical protein
MDEGSDTRGRRASPSKLGRSEWAPSLLAPALRRCHLFELCVDLVGSLATALISRYRVEKVREVLHESDVDHVSQTLEVVRQSTVHVYRGDMQKLSCPHRLSGKFFALEDLGDLYIISGVLRMDLSLVVAGVSEALGYTASHSYRTTLRLTSVRRLASRTACACALRMEGQWTRLI